MMMQIMGDDDDSDGYDDDHVDGHGHDHDYDHDGDNDECDDDYDDDDDDCGDYKDGDTQSSWWLSLSCYLTDGYFMLNQSSLESLLQ